MKLQLHEKELNINKMIAVIIISQIVCILFIWFIENFVQKDYLGCFKIHIHIHAFTFFGIILRTLEVLIIVLIHLCFTGHIY